MKRNKTRKKKERKKKLLRVFKLMCVFGVISLETSEGVCWTLFFCLQVQTQDCDVCVKHARVTAIYTGSTDFSLQA